MRTTFRLVSMLLIPFLLINACLYAVAPVLAHASEERITRFEPESAESEATPEVVERKTFWLTWWPWGISAAVIGFIAVGIGGMKKHGDSGGGGTVDVGW